jgi:aminoglycoside 2''-phosphotransferase
MSSSYIEHLKQVYPNLVIEDHYLNDIGQNNDVLIINNSLVFRFPKYKNGIVALKKEMEILEYLKNIVSIPIPHPIYHSFESHEPGKVFAGYHIIEGEPLWRKSVEKIKSPELVSFIAAQLVAFLTELHSVSEEEVRGVLKLECMHPEGEMTELFHKIKTKLFPYIRKDAQNDIVHSFEGFLNGKLTNLKTTLIHGDFGASNILRNPENSKVTGIIDFGGSGIGDPAYDFAGILASYGKDFFDLCIDKYPNGKEISERVAFYKSTFALQEALHGVENHDREAFENGLKEYR